MADHATRDADALLLWYRTCGRECADQVGRYLARRIIAADWSCHSVQAHAIILDAMQHVALRRPRPGAKDVGMRREDYQELRAQASAWLRAGLMDAVWRYEMANL